MHRNNFRHMLGYLIILLCSLLAYSLHTTAQSTYQLSVASVLPPNSVRTVLQDKYGYMWFATTSGLVRYDGYQAEVIKPSASGNRKLMQDYRIVGIKAWGKRFLWIRLRAQLFCCYDLERNAFVDYTGNGTYTQPISKYAIVSDKELFVWNDGTGRRILWDGKTFTSTTVALPEKDVVNYITAGQDRYLVAANGTVYLHSKNKFQPILYTSAKTPICKVTEAFHYNGTLFLTTNDGIYEYHLQSKRLARSAYNPKQAHIVLDNLGNIVIVSYDGSTAYYLTPKKTYRLGDFYSQALVQLNTKPRYQFYNTGNGKLWIATYGNGVFAYDLKDGRLDSYRDLLPSPYVIAIAADKSGNIWAALENMDVHVINFSKSKARYIYSRYGNGGINHFNDVRLLKRLGDQVYISSYQSTNAVADAALKEIMPFGNIQDGVTAVARDAKGQLYVGTRKEGIFAMGEGKNYAHSDAPHSIAKGKLSDILFDKKGRMWVSVFDAGLDVLVNGKFVHVIENKYLQGRNMVMDKQGNIWLCTSLGAIRFNPDQLLRNHKAYQVVHVSPTDKINDEVHCIYADSKGRVWIGSIGNGVKVIDGKKSVTYTTHDGLADNNVQSIVEHRETGDIWLGTDHGVSRFRKGAFNNFHFGDTPLGNACTEGNAVELSNGNIAFATHHGIMTFNPHNIRESKPVYPLAITNIEASGISIGELEGDEVRLDGPLSSAKELTVSHNNNSLTFYFSDFYYDKKSSSSFTYYMEGYDKTWSSLSNLNFAQYRNMPVGHYTLHVRSCDANGVWSPKEVTLHLEVRPPLYATWWAYLIYISIIAIAIYFVYHNLRRINALRNQVLVENQLTEYKLRFFTNISHEFRTPLTIIQGDMERLKTVDKVPGEMKQPLSSMAKSVERMMRLVNQLLEFRKMQNDKLQLALEKTDVIAFLQDIFLNLKNIAENKHINYMFLPFDKSYEMYVDRNYLDKITYNILSNALKYTPSHGDVAMRISLNADNRLLISVEDTGVGIEKAKQSLLFQRFNRSSYSHDSIGIGLHLTAELVRVHHGDISYLENQPQGSIFRVELPTDKSVYEDKDFMAEDNAVTREENSSNSSRSSLEMEYREMPPRPLNNYSVLIVEDDYDVREFLKNELQRYFETDTACDGQEAWEKVQTKKPALIISDVMMPRLNGYELVKKVRNEQGISDVPVILLTALTADDKHLKGIDAGADAYIEKPFHTSILIATCCQLLEQRHHLQQVYGQQPAGNAKQTAPEIIRDEQDKKFQNMLDSWLAEHIADPELNIDTFAKSMGYGRTSFYKKMKQITGTTPNDYIRTLRMNKAAELLKDDRLTVAEVSYRVGVDDQFYFSKMFKNFFGISPTAYRTGK